jgi:hypothetical protein
VKKVAVSKLQDKVEELEAQLEAFSAHAYLAQASEAEEAASDSEEKQEDNVVVLTAFDKEEELAENEGAIGK